MQPSISNHLQVIIVLSIPLSHSQNSKMSDGKTINYLLTTYNKVVQKSRTIKCVLRTPH